MTTKARLTRTLTQNKFLNGSMQNCKKKKKIRKNRTKQEQMKIKHNTINRRCHMAINETK